MNVYMPANCARLCTLRPDAIGQKTAFMIAALYQPDGNIEQIRRRAERIIGRPIAKATFRRHAEHLRPSTLTIGPPFVIPGEDPREGLPDTKEALLADMRASATEEPNNHWRHAIAAVEVATDWWAAYDVEMFELGELDTARANAETLLTRP